MTQAGASQFSDEQNSVFAVTFASSGVSWEKVTTLADADGKVELSGRVTSPAAFIYGLVNVGAYGVKDCQSDPRVAAPRFRITCQLDPADTSAWLGIQALAPGRVLAQTVGRVLLRREGTALGYSAPTKNLPPQNVTSAADFVKRLLSLVNETRAAARLPALRLAARASETSARLAPHYFQSEIGVDATADTIALGLLAGWDIKGPTIRSGDFYSSSLSGSLDARRWLSFMLEQPTARRVLLSPKATAIAIGPQLDPQTQSVAALINTYAFYDSDDHRADIERFVTRLNERRVALGLAPAKISQAPEVASAVRAVKTSHDPEAALNDAMQQVVERVQRGVEGYYIEASDLDHVSLPEALLRPSVTIAVSAAHHRYPQAAWGTLTLLVVVLESSGPQRTASLPRTPG
jgi:hypothetical protein